MRSIKSRLLLKGYKNKQSIITILLALVVMAGQAQQTMTVKDSKRSSTDTVVSYLLRDKEHL